MVLVIPVHHFPCVSSREVMAYCLDHWEFASWRDWKIASLNLWLSVWVIELLSLRVRPVPDSVLQPRHESFQGEALHSGTLWLYLSILILLFYLFRKLFAGCLVHSLQKSSKDQLNAKCCQWPLCWLADPPHRFNLHSVLAAHICLFLTENLDMTTCT